MMRSGYAKILRREFLAYQNKQAIENFLAKLSFCELEFLQKDWQIWARDDQLPPSLTKAGLPWSTWLILGGRGAGKTRAGAEWVRAQALGTQPLACRPCPRIALIGETLADVRSVMIEGVSGILSISNTDDRPLFEPSKKQLVWKNGSIAQMFSSEDPESLRGPQFGAAWCDELAKWRHCDMVWDMLQFGMRLGENPRQVVTTTPRPLALIKKLLEDPKCAVSRSSTFANKQNLAPAFLTSIVERYDGTRLGRQELNAEILEEQTGALWSTQSIDNYRVACAPKLNRVLVAVDPPISSNKDADLCGIVGVGCGVDKRAYVLSDRSIGGLRPLQWATRAVELYRGLNADCLLVEINQGGEMAEHILQQVDATVPIKNVRAHRGKWMRAEPVAALYERGLVSHVGHFAELEDQMCDFSIDGKAFARSPDRLDALVWALSELMLVQPGQPRMQRL